MAIIQALKNIGEEVSFHHIDYHRYSKLGGDVGVKTRAIASVAEQDVKTQAARLYKTSGSEAAVKKQVQDFATRTKWKLAYVEEYYKIKSQQGLSNMYAFPSGLAVYSDMYFKNFMTRVREWKSQIKTDWLKRKTFPGKRKGESDGNYGLRMMIGWRDGARADTLKQGYRLTDQFYPQSYERQARNAKTMAQVYSARVK